MTTQSPHLPIPASDLNAAYAITDPLGASTWTSYVPSWTGSGSNPVIGNGQLAGEYIQVGKTVWATGIMVAGTTTSYGTGNWQLSYPVTPTSRAGSTGGVIGTAYCLDFSAGGQYVSLLVSESTTILKIITSPTTVTANTVTPTVPFTWAVSDRFSWFLMYQAA